MSGSLDSQAFFGGELSDQGKEANKVLLRLKNAKGHIVDEVNQWDAGNFETNTKEKILNTVSMERINPRNSGNDKGNWCDATEFYNRNDENSPYDKGTPGGKNSGVIDN